MTDSKVGKRSLLESVSGAQDGSQQWGTILHHEALEGGADFVQYRMDDGTLLNVRFDPPKGDE